MVYRDRPAGADERAGYRWELPPGSGGEIEDVIWGYLHPDDRLQRDRIGKYRPPEDGERRSEALALAQLLIVSHLVGALDGAFEL